MVSKGQFLERPTLVSLSNGLVLEGLSHRGHRRPGLLVLPPPPIEGGGMDHVVGAEIAFAVSQQGFPCVRFNYRGVGASQGAVSRLPDDWVEDARAAISLAMSNTEGKSVMVATIGASDAVALQLLNEVQLAGMVIINPTMVRPRDIESANLPSPVAVVLAEHDEAHHRAEWSAVLNQMSGQLTVVTGATRAYQRNLTVVGQAVARALVLAERMVSSEPLPES